MSEQSPRQNLLNKNLLTIKPAIHRSSPHNNQKSTLKKRISKLEKHISHTSGTKIVDRLLKLVRNSSNSPDEGTSTAQNPQVATYTFAALLIVKVWQIQTSIILFIICQIRPPTQHLTHE